MKTETLEQKSKKLKLEKNTKDSFINYAIIIVAFVIMETLSLTGNISSSLKGFLVPICIYVIMAISLNLVVGILGELSLGHAGFMCAGAYSSSIFTLLTQDTITCVPLRFGLAILVGAATAAIFGVLIGIPVLRLNGDYLAIVTLAFGEIIKNLVTIVYMGVDSKGLHFSTQSVMDLNLEEDGKVIIKGAQGISGTPNNSNFIIATVLVLITLFIVQNLVNSRDGRAIMAIRDNKIAVESVGINVTKYKLMVFVISAALAGTAGVLYSHNFATLTSTGDKFNYNASIMILVYVVLGGIGNIRGSIIAAVVLYILPEELRFLSSYRMLVYAIVLIAVMLYNWSPKIKTFRETARYKIRSKFSGKKTKEANV